MIVFLQITKTFYNQNISTKLKLISKYMILKSNYYMFWFLKIAEISIKKQSVYTQQGSLKEKENRIPNIKTIKQHQNIYILRNNCCTLKIYHLLHVILWKILKIPIINCSYLNDIWSYNCRTIDPFSHKNYRNIEYLLIFHHNQQYPQFIIITNPTNNPTYPSKYNHIDFVIFHLCVSGYCD